MTDFTPTLRHRCRNPKCQMKLPAPVENQRDAFCIKSCYDTYYRRRCLICERPLVVKRGKPVLCKRAKCKAALRARSGLGKYAAPLTIPAAFKPVQEVPVNRASKPASWRTIAGPEPTPNELHCATFPDGPNCDWQDGRYQRAEAANRALLKEHFARLSAKAQIQRHHAPVNILGGHRSAWRAARPPYEILAITPDIDLSPIVSTRHVSTIKLDDDLSIPPFLRRVRS